MLPVVAFPFEDFYTDTHHATHTLERSEQQALFYTGLLAAALGIGGIRAILCPLGAYSVQGYDHHRLFSFFNWFYWLVNLNSTVVFLGIAYIQQSVAKNLGFLIPFTSAVLGMLAIHMVRQNLTFRPKKGGSLITTLGVFLSSLKMSCLRYGYLSGEVGSWLDRAKENNGGRYSEAHVENVKIMSRLFPLYGLQLLYRTCVAQIPSGYYLQAMHSNLKLNGFLLPIGVMNVISILPLLVLSPLLHGGTRLCCPVGPGRGGVGDPEEGVPLVEQSLSGKVLHVSSMGCFQLTPQYVLLGLAEALVTPACSLLAFRLAPGSVRGVSLNLLSLSYGGGCFLGALIIQLVYLLSGGNFYPDSLSDGNGNLERFFFLLAALMAINTLVFWRISYRYSDLSVELGQGGRSHLAEKLLQHKKCLRFYDTVERSYTLASIETIL
ncbi:hypothetical protein ANANG_G00315030 [Anguilla anguilla]|uniref:Solute carrier family 15 member 5 n=1 Tax=Anguilla anguilla TaxID=7936 RepID=A0A9D3LL18_ANGAN|nr:hypothetical protein ANANG_G00315030 [Anguilla anguilla]